jgi:hypothetical protein
MVYRWRLLGVPEKHLATVVDVTRVSAAELRPDLAKLFAR